MSLLGHSNLTRVMIYTEPQLEDLAGAWSGWSDLQAATPHAVSWNGARYLVGPGVARYARPLQRLDFQRLADGPELRALTYGVLAQSLGPGQHEASLIIGLPVEVMADRDLATATLKGLRKWLVGDHTFQVDDAACRVTVRQVKALAQPVGAFFAWGLDDAGRWRRSADDLKAPAGVCDIGFNTLDLFAVEGGQVIARYTGGETLGMRRAAETLADLVRRAYNITLSLPQADALLRERSPKVYVAGQPISVRPLVNQALDATAASALAYIERHWDDGRQFAHLLFTGGGSQALRSHLLRAYPHGVILPDPLTANAAGLARYARRVFKMPALAST
jgi:hypothetical protein